MNASRFTNFQSLGIGIGLRVPHYEHILTKKPMVDWFEIISENFMVMAAGRSRCSTRFSSSTSVVQHGVVALFRLGGPA